MPLLSLPVVHLQRTQHAAGARTLLTCSIRTKCLKGTCESAHVPCSVDTSRPLPSAHTIRSFCAVNVQVSAPAPDVVDAEMKPQNSDAHAESALQSTGDGQKGRPATRRERFPLRATVGNTAVTADACHGTKTDLPLVLTTSACSRALAGHACRQVFCVVPMSNPERRSGARRSSHELSICVARVCFVLS